MSLKKQGLYALCMLCSCLCIKAFDPALLCDRSCQPDTEKALLDDQLSERGLITPSDFDEESLSAGRVAEYTFLSAREMFVAQRVKKGISLSGGGTRAAIANFGALKGLAQVYDHATGKSMIDRTVCMTSLSGSTWLMQVLYSHAHKSFLSIDELRAFEGTLKHNLTLSFLNPMVHEIFHKHMIDIWADCISNQYFADNIALAREHLSQTAFRIDPKDAPIPILTAALDMVSITKPSSGFNWVLASLGSLYKKVDYDMLTLTPFMASACLCGRLVDMPQFEQKFRTSIGSELTTGLTIGMCGSAYAVSTRDIYDQAVIFLTKKPTSQAPIDLTKAGIVWQPAVQVPNDLIGSFEAHTLCPAYTPNCFNEKSSNDLIITKDGGIISCIPDLPLIRQDCELLIDIDASGSSPENCLELMKNEKFYAAYNTKVKCTGIPYPAIGDGMHTCDIFVRKNSSTNETYVMKIFYGHAKTDYEPMVPTVLYIPNLHPFSTTKFEYTSQEFDVLAGSMERAVLAFAPELNALSEDPFTHVSQAKENF